MTPCYCGVQETSGSPATRVQLATALFHSSDAEIKTEFQKLMRKYFQVLLDLDMCRYHYSSDYLGMLSNIYFQTTVTAVNFTEAEAAAATINR